MRNHRIRSTLAVIGLALVASAALAQAPKKPVQKDTAARHIKITKETPKTTKRTNVAGGDVLLPPAPVVVQAGEPAPQIIMWMHDDSVRMEQYRLDSIGNALAAERMRVEMLREEQANRERMRLDSIAAADAQARALARALARGAYVAFAGGASTPQRAIRDGYTGGWNLTLPVGYDATDNPLGVRMDASVDHLNGTRVHDLAENTLAASGDVTVWSLNADAKLRFHAPGMQSRSHLYLLGGVGAHRVTGGVYGTTSDRAGQNLTFADAGTKFGWNAGAGATIAWNGAELFVESRFFQVKSDLGFHQNGGVGTYTSFTPIVFGLHWF